MVRNDILITLTFYYNKSAHKMMVLVSSACGEGSDDPACMHDLAMAFVSGINKVCRLKMTPNNF